MLQEDVRWLTSLLDLSRKPVGIRFLLDEEDYKDSCFPESSCGLPYCTAVRNAASKNRGCKLALEHMACMAAARALGMAEGDNYVASGRRYADMGVYQDLCTSRAIVRDMVYCKHHAYGVEVAPLEAYNDSLPPDVVIVVSTPYNIMRLVQAYAYKHGHLQGVQMAGMQAVCQECTSLPYETNRPNISLMCSGTRCVAQWGKEELGMGFPYHFLHDLVEGLRGTSNHMDQNAEKQLIEDKLTRHGLQNEHTVAYDRNYYTGAFGTLEQQNRRKENNQ